MDVLTHKPDRPEDAEGRMCRCSSCGRVEECRPEFDFYGEPGQLLVCEACLKKTLGPEDMPMLDLKPARVQCARHGQPFQATWPRGYPIFALTLMQALLATATESIEEIGQQLDTTPACCRVSAPVLLEGYQASGVGVLGRCRICRARALGTPYSLIAAQSNTLQHLDHVCFGCVINKLVARSN